MPLEGAVQVAAHAVHAAVQLRPLLRAQETLHLVVLRLTELLQRLVRGRVVRLAAAAHLEVALVLGPRLRGLARLHVGRGQREVLHGPVRAGGRGHAEQLQGFEDVALPEQVHRFAVCYDVAVCHVLLQRLPRS